VQVLILFRANTSSPTLQHILFSTPGCPDAALAAGLNQNGGKLAPHKPSSKITTALLFNHNIFISLMTLWPLLKAQITPGELPRTGRNRSRPGCALPASGIPRGCSMCRAGGETPPAPQKTHCVPAPRQSFSVISYWAHHHPSPHNLRGTPTGKVELETLDTDWVFFSYLKSNGAWRTTQRAGGSGSARRDAPRPPQRHPHRFGIQTSVAGVGAGEARAGHSPPVRQQDPAQEQPHAGTAGDPLPRSAGMDANSRRFVPSSSSSPSSPLPRAHPAPTIDPSAPPSLSHNHTCAKLLPYIRKRENILGEPSNQTIFKIMEH